MKVVLTLIAVICALTSPARKNVNRWGQRMNVLQDKVKKTTYSTSLLADTTGFANRPLDTNDIRVDSLNKEGYEVLSYYVRNGLKYDVLKYRYEFDAAGQEIKEFYIDDSRHFISTTTFVYDTAGNVIEEISKEECPHCDTSRLSTGYTYASGLLTGIETRTYKLEYKYNNAGQKIEEVDYSKSSPKRPPSVTRYTYGDKGIVTAEEYYPISKKSLTQTYQYDEHDNVVNHNGLFKVYIYDSHRNWIYELEQRPLESYIMGVEPIQWYRLTIRKIEYY